MTDPIRIKLNSVLVSHSHASTTFKFERSQYIRVEDNLTYAQECQSLIQTVAQKVQQEAHDRIASVVSRCLEAVFENPYEFRIHFEQRRGRTEADLHFVRDGLVLDDPRRQIGGGVCDVASFALRLACLILSRPPKRRLLVLDEPFSKIRGRQNRERIRDLVLALAEELDIQFIINVDTSVYPEFELGTVVRLEK